jgi:type IV pilus assembly protein PilX
MSSNMYDRSIAMQGAEAALRAAEAAISASATYNNRDCSGEDGTPIQCEPAPPSTFTGGTDTGIAWIDVTSTFQTNAALATGTAQYHIQYLGQGTSVDELGLGNSANFMQYGAGGGVPQANYYQVIVRSHAPDPNSDIDDSRAIVVLSAGYRRNI